MFYHRDTEDTEFWKSENLNPKLRVLCVSVVNNFSVLSSPLCALLPGYPLLLSFESLSLTTDERPINHEAETKLRSRRTEEPRAPGN